MNSGQTSEVDDKDSGVLSRPLSFNRSGVLRWYNASPSLRSDEGDYWSLRTYSTTSSGSLYFNHGTGLAPQDNSAHGYGFAVRCVTTLQILHHSL